jgi:hypothetical protein
MEWTRIYSQIHFEGSIARFFHRRFDLSFLIDLFQGGLIVGVFFLQNVHFAG